MSTGVGGAGCRIGARVSGHPDRVKLAHHRQGGTWPPGIQDRLQAGYPESGLHVEPQIGQPLVHPLRSVKLLKTHFGIVKNRLAQGDD